MLRLAPLLPRALAAAARLFSSSSLSSSDGLGGCCFSALLAMILDRPLFILFAFSRSSLRPSMASRRGYLFPQTSDYGHQRIDLALVLLTFKTIHFELCLERDDYFLETFYDLIACHYIYKDNKFSRNDKVFSLLFYDYFIDNQNITRRIKHQFSFSCGISPTW